jgi:hypothetical protein
MKQLTHKEKQKDPLRFEFMDLRFFEDMGCFFTLTRKGHEDDVAICITPEEWRELCQKVLVECNKGLTMKDKNQIEIEQPKPTHYILANRYAIANEVAMIDLKTVTHFIRTNKNIEFIANHGQSQGLIFHFKTEEDAIAFFKQVEHALAHG